MDQLTVTSKEGTDYVLYELSGALDAYTIQNLQNKIYDSIKKQNVVVDMANVTSLDAAAMGFIMAAHNDGEEYGTTLYLLSISNEVDRQLLATGFKDLFHLISSVTEVK